MDYEKQPPMDELVQLLSSMTDEEIERVMDFAETLHNLTNE